MRQPRAIFATPELTLQCRDTVRLMKLEKELSGDADMKRLLADLNAATTVDAEYPPKCDVQVEFNLQCTKPVAECLGPMQRGI